MLHNRTITIPFRRLSIGRKIDDLVQGVIDGDRKALAKSITLLESRLPSDQIIASELFHSLNLNGKRCNSIRLGLSGAPGVGKSTFIEQFGMFLVQQDRKLAVLVKSTPFH